jgi:lipid A ethanolaminephosphotransferase
MHSMTSKNAEVSPPLYFRIISNRPAGNTLVLTVAIFLSLVTNATFFSQTIKAYPLSSSNALALATLPIMLCAATTLLLAILSFGRLSKPVLVIVLLLSSLAACYMDSYGVIFNNEMLQNISQTNIAEASDLVNPRMFFYFVLLGILPAIVVVRIPLYWRGWRVELLARLKLVVLSIGLIVAIAVVFGDFYASFIRQHKTLRSYANPVYYVYSSITYISNHWIKRGDSPLVVVGRDAHIPANDMDRELVIVVVGETARADRFSLNGYARETNPLLRKESVISFTNFRACGTSTAVSVPCMFSLRGRNSYNDERAMRQENVLDVIQHSGAYVLWLDNNSDSKGVAERIPFENYRSPEKNPVCDEECRDEGMLAHLQEKIDAQPSGDVVIVLHQMGNHGPAYYKRYPKAFERFAPTCKSSDLSQCSNEEISNAYDNAILYTDYFLSKVIELLKRNDSKFQTAMFYLSDHGESLGEKGVYLHGLPYLVAPDTQLRVPAIMWFGANFDAADVSALAGKRDARFTHDHLSHTLLGFLEIETGVYRPEMDILLGVREPGETGQAVLLKNQARAAQ